MGGGCENCGFFEMVGDRERVADCTTPNFQSVLSVMDPSTSWAAKWQHLSEHLNDPYLNVSSILFLHTWLAKVKDRDIQNTVWSVSACAQVGAFC